jgi:hypothetical protein
MHNEEEQFSIDHLSLEPGSTIRVLSVKNHHNDLHRVYDIPDKFRWVGESIVPRCFIFKVPGGSLGIILEIQGEQLKVLFHGGSVGWIKSELVEVVDPQQL